MFGDQAGEAFPRKDDDVGGHMARELRLDGLRSAALRRTGAGGDRDAGRALEQRDELFVGA